MDAPDLHQRALEETSRLARDIRVDQLDVATPCEGWTVRQLLGHMTGGNVRWIRMAAGEDVQLGVPDAAIDDPGEYIRSAKALDDAWRKPGLLQRTFHRGRDVTGDWLLRQHIVETVVHGWDLARAIGGEPRFPEDVVAAAMEFATTNMPVERPPGSPFAPATDATGTSVEINKLAAFMGRDLSATR